MIFDEIKNGNGHVTLFTADLDWSLDTNQYEYEHNQLSILDNKDLFPNYTDDPSKNAISEQT